MHCGHEEEYLIRAKFPRVFLPAEETLADAKTRNAEVENLESRGSSGIGGRAVQLLFQQMTGRLLEWDLNGLGKGIAQEDDA